MIQLLLLSMVCVNAAELVSDKDKYIFHDYRNAMSEVVPDYFEKEGHSNFILLFQTLGESDDKDYDDFRFYHKITFVPFAWIEENMSGSFTEYLLKSHVRKAFFSREYICPVINDTDYMFGFKDVEPEKQNHKISQSNKDEFAKIIDEDFISITFYISRGRVIIKEM